MAAGSSPDAREIVARSVKVTEANWLEAPNYSFIRSDIKSKHRSQSARQAYQVLMIEGSPYLNVIGEEGHPLSATRTQEEEQKVCKEMAKRANESPGEHRKRIGKGDAPRFEIHKEHHKVLDMRDQIVDFVRRWSEMTEIRSGRFIEWLDITVSKYCDWSRSLPVNSKTLEP